MSLSVPAGATIKVTNKDSVAHTLTATSGQFDTGNIEPVPEIDAGEDEEQGIAA